MLDGPAGKLGQFARDVIRSRRPAIFQSFEFAIPVDGLHYGVKGYSGRLKKRDDHLVQEGHLLLEVFGVSAGHGSTGCCVDA